MLSNPLCTYFMRMHHDCLDQASDDDVLVYRRLMP